MLALKNGSKLGTTEFYPLIVLEAVSLKWSTSRAMFPLKPVERILPCPLPASGEHQESLMFLGLQLDPSSCCLHCHVGGNVSPTGWLCPGFLWVTLCPHFPLLIRTPVTGIGPNLIEYGCMLTPLYLQSPDFHIRSRSPVLEIRTWTYIFEGWNSTRNSVGR